MVFVEPHSYTIHVDKWLTDTRKYIDSLNDHVDQPTPDQARRSLAAVLADVTSPRNLNPTRRHRSYPRVVRRARHNSYRVKRPGDTGTRYHGPPTIRLVNLRPGPP